MKYRKYYSAIFCLLEAASTWLKNVRRHGTFITNIFSWKTALAFPQFIGFIGLSLTCSSWILLISSCSYCQVNSLQSNIGNCKQSQHRAITVYGLQRVNEMDLIKGKLALLKKPSRLVCYKSVHEMYFQSNLKHIFIMASCWWWCWYCFGLLCFLLFGLLFVSLFYLLLFPDLLFCFGVFIWVFLLLLMFCFVEDLFCFVLF